MKPDFAPLRFLLLVFAGWVNHEQQAAIDYLREENTVLREQLGDRRIRFTDAQRRRLAVRGKVLGRKLLASVAGIVTPDTILRWYRKLIAKKYDGTAKRGPGRPKTKPDIAELLLWMARDNPGWGYTRIRGALFELGHDIGRNTIKRILLEHGLEPAPERGKQMRWSTFLKAHGEAIAAADFVTVEVMTLFGLVRHWVFFVIKLETRKVEIAGIKADPHGRWMMQVGRNLTDSVDGFLLNMRYLILDRDPLYTASFRQLLKDSGCKVVRLPARSPNLNAYAERFVLSNKSECLSRIVPLGENHLRHAISEYIEHYHGERTHQGLGNRLIEPENTDVVAGNWPVQRRQRLGGLLNFYYRDAA